MVLVKNCCCERNGGLHDAGQHGHCCLRQSNASGKVSESGHKGNLARLVIQKTFAAAEGPFSSCHDARQMVHLVHHRLSNRQDISLEFQLRNNASHGKLK